MDETYRMLGREREADLAREAANWRLADEARGAKRAAKTGPPARSRLNPAHAATLFARAMVRLAASW